MPGLLGDSFEDPRSAAIMALSAGLLQRNPGAGLLGANAAYANARNDASKRQYVDLQTEEARLKLKQAKRAVANEQGLQGLMPQYFRPGTPGMGGTGAVNSALPPDMQIGAQPAIPAQGPQFDMKGYTAAAMQHGYMNPLDAIKLQQAMAKDSQINKLDVKDFTPASVQKYAQSGNYADLERMDKLHFGDTGGALVGANPFTGRPVSSIPKTGNPFSDLVLADGQGGVMPNSPLIGAKQSIAKSGAANTSVKIENKMGEGVAAQVGPMLRESLTAANGAAQTVDAANRITSALDSNKVFAGPGANARLKVAQVSQILGIGGKDEAEKIANTRQAIRGLSEMTLKGRQQMSGQGAITNQESQLAERAMSGDIADLTIPEIRMLAGASARAARFVYDQHQSNVTRLASDPNTAGLAKFYQPMPLPMSPRLPSAGSGGAQAQPGAGARFLGFE